MSDTQGILDAARDRGLAAIAAEPRIDWKAGQRAYVRQKAALTRAVNSGDPEKVKAVVISAVREWRQPGMFWPDDWSRWQNALDDTLGLYDSVMLKDIR